MFVSIWDRIGEKEIRELSPQSKKYFKSLYCLGEGKKCSRAKCDSYPTHETKTITKSADVMKHFICGDHAVAFAKKNNLVIETYEDFTKRINSEFRKG